MNPTIPAPHQHDDESVDSESEQLRAERVESPGLSSEDAAAVAALLSPSPHRLISEMSDDELEERIHRAEEELALMGDREAILAVQLRALDYLLEHPQSSLPPLWSEGARSLDAPNLRALISKFSKDAR